MGSYHCKYCGCPEKYYSSESHASRPSCFFSDNKRHHFIYYINYDIYLNLKNIKQYFCTCYENINPLNLD